MTGERDEEFVEHAEERLERLEKDIAKAREDSEEVVEGTYDDPEERFSSSGDERGKREDDQTIAPG